MGDDVPNGSESSDLQTILEALEDPDCREILKATEIPTTAQELNEQCDIPSSTLYRKLELLSSASLLKEHYSIHPERGRITRYQRNMNTLSISIDEDDQFTVNIDRPKKSVEERLADIWSEMGEEL